ncbi:MAG: polysaccharide deacetylase family protein [Caldimonas sp.]
MSSLKGLAFAIAGMPAMRRLLPPRTAALTTVLYHGFFFAGEPRQRARDRLRRQLEWLSRSYRPLTLEQCQQALATGTVPPDALLVTADDAKVDLLEVHEEFAAFGVPLCVFVCAGWTAQASELSADDLLARTVAALEWQAGPDAVVSLGPEARPLSLGPASRSATIDALLAAPGYFVPHLEELLARLAQAGPTAGPRTICSWPELVSLKEKGVRFGSHSVSHIRLAAASQSRLRFEVAEAKRLIERKLAPCTAFAYPFGTEGTWNARTTTVVRASGASIAFLTHPGFATTGSELLHLPRFALPERAMPDAEYRGRVAGAGVALGALKARLALRRRGDLAAR